jgi:hypothetical protein
MSPQRQPERPKPVPPTPVQKPSTQESEPAGAAVEASAKVAEAGTGGPGGPGPPATMRPYYSRHIVEAARTADEAARRARARRGQVLAILGALVAIAVAAVGLGIAANSAAFWGAAGAVFLGAFSVLIAFLARELGVFSESAELVTRLLARAVPSDGGPSRAPVKGQESLEQAPQASELTRALFALGKELHEKRDDMNVMAELFGDDVVPESEVRAVRNAYLDAAHLSFERAWKAGDGRAGSWAGRMKCERGSPREAEDIYLLTRHPLGSYWLGSLHVLYEPSDEPRADWYLKHAQDGNLLAAYVLGRLHQRNGSFDFDAGVRLLEPEI